MGVGLDSTNIVQRISLTETRYGGRAPTICRASFRLQIRTIKNSVLTVPACRRCVHTHRRR